MEWVSFLLLLLLLFRVGHFFFKWVPCQLQLLLKLNNQPAIEYQLGFFFLFFLFNMKTLTKHNSNALSINIMSIMESWCIQNLYPLASNKKQELDLFIFKINVRIVNFLLICFFIKVFDDMFEKWKLVELLKFIKFLMIVYLDYLYNVFVLKYLIV